MKLSDVIPQLQALHAIVLGVLAVVIAATAFHVGGLRGDARADAAELAAAKAAGEQQRQDALILAARQAAADQRIAEVAKDVADTERRRQALADQQTSLRQQNAKLSGDLARSRDAVGLLERRVEAYGGTAPGASTAACAAVAGRARVLGDLLRQSLDLLSESAGLLEEGRDLAGEGSNALSDTAGYAELYGDRLREWQQYDATVVHPGAPPTP